jgi:hypothetical protein
VENIISEAEEVLGGYGIDVREEFGKKNSKRAEEETENSLETPPRSEKDIPTESYEGEQSALEKRKEKDAMEENARIVVIVVGLNRPQELSGALGLLSRQMRRL